MVTQKHPVAPAVQMSEHRIEPTQVTVIDFNVAVELQEKDSTIRGGTGLKEWSAPETRLKLFTDFKVDTWTLGCVMFLLCTGE